MTSAEVSAWLGEDLPPRTDRSKGLGALLTELEDIRRSGFAYDDEEHTEGVSAISVSIGTYRGAYAITIIAPTARLHSKMDSFREEIGRAHVCTPVTNAHLVCRHLLANKQTIIIPY